jgi:exonuclease VII small subunit
MRELAGLAATLAADAARIACALDARSGRRAVAPSRALARAEEILKELERGDGAPSAYARGLEAAALAAVALAEARAALDAIAQPLASR